jgi:hypothetical protein
MSIDMSGVFGGIAGAGDVSLAGQGEYLKEGEHDLALVRYEGKKDKEGVVMIVARFRVVESNVHQKGEEVDIIWKVNAAGWAGKYHREFANEFGRAVVGGLGGDARNPALVQQALADLHNGTATETFAGRGLRCHGRTTRRMTKEKNREVFNTSWSPISQTKEQIAECRRWIETTPVTPPQRKIGIGTAASSTAASPSAPPAGAPPAPHGSGLF